MMPASLPDSLQRWPGGPLFLTLKMTIPATESSPMSISLWDDNGTLESTNCFVWKARTGQVSHAQNSWGWPSGTHSQTQSLSAGLRALSSWSNTETLMSFPEDSTTGELVVYRQRGAFSLGGRAQNRVLGPKRHLVYGTHLAGEIWGTWLSRTAWEFHSSETHCSPCLELCYSFFIWELLTKCAPPILGDTKKWGGGVQSSHLSL